MKNIEQTLQQLVLTSNFRVLPEDSSALDVVDLSTNDYLGLAADTKLKQEYLDGLSVENFVPTSSASRLLSVHQHAYSRMEALLERLYGRPALLFNSGYHANTGLVSALGSRSTLMVADRLVHASIIDGMKLSGARFERYRHNDYAHLESILTRLAGDFSRVVIISEAVFSMDGDRADIDRLVELKRRYANTLLYIDEAHSIGVCGPAGLGLTVASSHRDDVDIMVGTFGKALASVGAFAVMSPRMKQFMVNRARSLIFSTMLPPAVVDWSYMTLTRALEMDDARSRLTALSGTLSRIIASYTGRQGLESHIQPLVVGDAAAALKLSERLGEAGYKVLAIRTPTVQPGTERLRFSLSAALTPESLAGLVSALGHARR